MTDLEALVETFHDDNCIGHEQGCCLLADALALALRVRREALEQARAAQCSACATGSKPFVGELGAWWYHCEPGWSLTVKCECSDALRALLSEGEVTT